MSFWRRLFTGRGGKARVEREKSAPQVLDPRLDPGAPRESSEPEEDPDLRALRTGATLAEQMGAFCRLRGTVRESEALRELARARAAGTLDERLVVAGADLHVQRGELDDAAELLRDVSLPAGLLLAADVNAERGAWARALALVERVLARDIDAPGARERHERWSGQLGGAPCSPGVAPNEPTVLRADAQGDLRIVGEAGRGGAAAVYEAMDDTLGRRVALKVYHRPTEDREQLVREARIAVCLAGDHIVQVLDADPSQGFIVMAWLGGGALKGWLSRKDARRLLGFSVWYPKLVGAVARVHHRGWVHADLKPANVLFRNDTYPVVSDFGLAQRPGCVETGGSMGYLSPERIAGEPLTAADDVFALGRILEDVLDTLDEPAEFVAWRAIARLATSDERPRDATQLLEELRLA